ncbi:nuclear transport factor 2 family protein [Pseudoclavibacter endophyticus]|uniref:nuclear transport factor 2 family protein n=1 Tax=Pseudoclavibacter endophyticus TaxID=1778590 RepID=UPI001664526F|nr:nuclear transport factor 2 family protein [Pseudoclavibacter endophyticus]
MQRVESIREVKDLQRRYAHLGQLGNTRDMAGLFGDDATVEGAARRWSGRAEIDAFLQAEVAPWASGASGALHFEVIDQPLITLSDSGEHASGRWHSLRFLGDGVAVAQICAGIYENEYHRSEAGWRISSIRYVPLYDGDYVDGWTNTAPTGVPIVPPHFTAEQVGAPAGPARPADSFGEAEAGHLATRIARLNDEDDVRNLLHAFGYYVDRKMWADVHDLFAEEACIRVGQTEYSGQEGVHRALHEMGAAGLVTGELNDRMIFGAIVDVRPGGEEADVRGFEVALLADPESGEGHWEFSVFRNRMVKHDGLWRIHDVTVSRVLRATYADGWATGGIDLEGNSAPPPVLNPAPRSANAQERAQREHEDVQLADLDRKLSRSRAYDAVENLSAAYGYYLDDFQWPEMAALFATNGHKQSPFAGYYFGPERILGAATASHGAPRDPAVPRARAVLHWRPQSVVMVSHDGRSANLRARLFQMRTAADVLPEWTGIHSGNYANDQAVLDGGVWRLWSVTIDEYYFVSPSWSGGWASAQVDEAKPQPPSKLLSLYPPDIAMDELGERMRGFRGGPGPVLAWPEIAPMWFNYRNPVSGRTPVNYWPDCVPSVVDSSASMLHHGYQLPPTGPSVDGKELP